MDIIDPHLHLFNLSEGQYYWLRPENPPFWPDKSIIAHSFNEQDLSLVPDINLIGYVHIEAGFDNDQSWREIDWIERQGRIELRSIGYIDLRIEPTKFKLAWQQLGLRDSCVGIRHILDDELEKILGHPNCRENLAFLNAQRALFELQFDVSKGSHTGQVNEILTHYSDIRFALNHTGFCPVHGTDKAIENWHSNMKSLAQRPNLWVKCSGFEMADRQFDFADAAARIASVIDLFGFDRVMLASNFPLVQFSCSYTEYWQQMLIALAQKNLPITALVQSNAARLYGFDPQTSQIR